MNPDAPHPTVPAARRPTPPGPIRVKRWTGDKGAAPSDQWLWLMRNVTLGELWRQTAYESIQTLKAHLRRRGWRWGGKPGALMVACPCRLCGARVERADLPNPYARECRGCRA